MTGPLSPAPRTALSLALLVVLLAAPAAPQAAGPNDKGAAIALLKEGARLLNEKEFAAALQKFRDAYRLVPSPKIQYNIGLAAEGLDRPAEAIRAYRSFLEATKPETDKHEGQARARIDALRARVTFLEVTADVAGATVMVDGVEEGQTPFAQP